MEQMMATWGFDMWDEECSSLGDLKETCMNAQWLLKRKQTGVDEQDRIEIPTAYDIPIKLLWDPDPFDRPPEGGVRNCTYGWTPIRGKSYPCPALQRTRGGVQPLNADETHSKSWLAAARTTRQDD